MLYLKILWIFVFSSAWIGWGNIYSQEKLEKDLGSGVSLKYGACSIRVQQKRFETTILAELSADGTASIYLNNRRYQWNTKALSKAMDQLRRLGFFESKDRKVALPWNVNALNRPWLEASYNIQGSDDPALLVLIESDKWTPEMVRFVKQFEAEVNTALKGQSGEALKVADRDTETPARVPVNSEAVARLWKGLVAREFGKSVDEYEGDWRMPYASMEFIFVELSSIDDVKRSGFDPFKRFRDSFEEEDGDLRCSTVEKQLRVWAAHSAQEK